MIRETVERQEERGRASVRDIVNFPTAAPPSPVVRPPMMMAEADVATLAVANGSNGAVAYATNGLATSVVADGYDDPSMVPQGNGAITVREIQRRWPEFVHTFDEKKTLLTALQTVQVAEMQGSTIRVFVAGELNLTLLQRNRKLVNDKLSEFFGVPLHLDCYPGAAPMPIPGESNGAVASGPHADHPFIRGIMELLGASPL
jgi:hypothetical protein